MADVVLKRHCKLLSFFTIILLNEDILLQHQQLLVTDNHVTRLRFIFYD